MIVTIYFVGGDNLRLNSSNIMQSGLESLVSWLRDNNGSEVMLVKYNMNGTLGEYILNRKNIAYIMTIYD